MTLLYHDIINTSDMNSLGKIIILKKEKMEKEKGNERNQIISRNGKNGEK